MKVGLIDVDGHNYPNLPLMKISAWHKSQGDHVEWYSPLLSGHMDRVYLSKVFSFTPDYTDPIDADEVIRGGSGYCIELEGGKEVYRAERDTALPPEIEHIYPDYGLYPEKTKNTAFWMGQEKIVLCDPNILACRAWEDLLGQLISSRALVDFNQGLDVRLATPEKIAMLNRIRMKYVHLAWDRPEEDLESDFERFSRLYSRKHPANKVVYVLVNFSSTLDQDFYRIYTLRRLGFDPFIMIYDKEHAVPISRSRTTILRSPTPA